MDVDSLVGPLVTHVNVLEIIKKKKTTRVYTDIFVSDLVGFTGIIRYLVGLFI